MLTTIAITIGVMAAGVVFGALVQKVTHFLDPIDFFTAAICCTVPLAYWMQEAGDLALPLDLIWGWPFLAGYLAGYAVSGRVDYTMVRTFAGDKTTSAEPYIFYYHEGSPYLQEQTWSGLAKRLFLGIRHEVIVVNGDLTPDWQDISKWPHFPRREHGEIIAEDLQTYTRERPAARIPRPKRYVTVITRAYGSTVSTTDSFTKTFFITDPDGGRHLLIRIAAERST